MKGSDDLSTELNQNLLHWWLVYRAVTGHLRGCALDQSAFAPYEP